MKKDNKKINNLMSHILIIIILLSTILLSFSAGLSNKDRFEKLIMLDGYRDIVVDNNLSIMDFCVEDKCKSDKDIYEFSEFIKKEYYYDELHDCKYWALVWSLYFEKHNIDYKLVMTNNHVFVISYFEDGYYLVDGKIFKEVLFI